MFDVHAHTHTDTHIRKTLNHTYKCFLTRSRVGAEFWGGGESAGCLYLCICYSNVLLYDFNLSKCNSKLQPTTFRSLKNVTGAKLTYCLLPFCVGTRAQDPNPNKKKPVVCRMFEKRFQVFGSLLSCLLPQIAFPADSYPLPVCP